MQLLNTKNIFNYKHTNKIIHKKENSDLKQNEQRNNTNIKINLK